jgi:hypothetical protein
MVVSCHHHLEVFESGQDLLEDMERLMEENEFALVKKSLSSKQIPTPLLLIKDHKKPCSTTGDHPTRLIVHAQNFTSAFPKLGYLAIHKILDTKNKFDYLKRTIIQASDLKTKLESQ